HSGDVKSNEVTMLIVGVVVGVTNQFDRCHIRPMSNVDILSRPNIGQTVSIEAVDNMGVRSIICYKASTEAIVSYTSHGSGHMGMRRRVLTSRWCNRWRCDWWRW